MRRIVPEGATPSELRIIEVVIEHPDYTLKHIARLLHYQTPRRVQKVVRKYADILENRQ